MSYTVEPINVTSTPKERVVDPRPKSKKISDTPYKWWMAQDDKTLTQQLLSTAEYLKKTNMQRIRQASVFSRLFSGKPLYNFLASNATLDNSNQLPIGRPTANVCYSCSDTLVSRISQDKPKPVFLTDGGNYKERKLSKEANKFIQGELYRTKAYHLGEMMVRDACVLGDGLIKVFPKDGKVCIERVLETELLVDFNDAYYGNPRQLIQLKLVDRSVFAEEYPDAVDEIAKAVHGNVDSTPRSTETISDQFIVCEAWHLPSGPDADDGRHVIACSEGIILDEPWKREKFPFLKLGFNPNVVGWFSQGLIEILMPTQMEIYRLLIVESQSIELMAVPRVLIEEMSKILETSFNNRIGSIIKYRNTPPTFVNSDAGLGERIHTWIEWLIQNAYQMAGISQLAASGVKPAGLNSGEAQRTFDEIQQDRFAAFQRRYQDVYPELAYMIIDCAKEIAEEKGKYETVYVGKDGTKVIDFKTVSKLSDNYVIQCYEESSLPKDPAGRQAKLSEMLAAGEITQQEFRRLSNFPDLEQSDQLAAALEERILYCLDEIVENGDKNYEDIAPDSFILDPSDLATTLCVNYINRYATLHLEEEKMNVLRTWFTQVQALKQQAMPPPMQAAPTMNGGAPAQGSPGMPPVAPPQASIGPTSNVAV
jgi:hypothetical protein